METDKFSLYLYKRFPNTINYFAKWDILGIEDDFPNWYVKNSWLKIYAFSKRNGEHNAQADIGCNKDVHHRIIEKNIKK